MKSALKQLKAIHARYGETIRRGRPLKGYPFTLETLRDGIVVEIRATRTKRHFGAFIRAAARES